MERKHELANGADDPERCQGSGGLGQCNFKGRPLENSDKRDKYCWLHTPSSVYKKEKIEAVNLYRSAVWKEKIKEQAGHSNIKTLNSEIGILRIILEEHLNAAKDAQELLMRSSTISELVDKISRLVQSCHKLDKELGAMLDKTQALKLANDFVQIISEFISDPVLLEAIAMQLTDRVEAVITESQKG